MTTNVRVNEFKSGDLQFVDNHELTRRLKLAITKERRATLEVLKFFREAERRMLYAEFGYSSLLDFAVRELGYSEPAAYRRISAMRVLREVPETSQKLQTGELNLTTVSKAQSFFRKSQMAGTKLATDEKRNVLDSLLNLSARNAEQVLVAKNPALFQARAESRRALPDGRVQISTVLSRETAAHLEEIQDLMGRTMNFAETIAYLADQQRKQLRKNLGLQRPTIANLNELECPAIERDATPPANFVKPPKDSTNPSTHKNSTSGKSMPTRHIPVNMRKVVYERSASRCEWINTKTGERCSATRYLQIDHVRPFAMGGKSTIQNLQLMCRTHNLLRAKQEFGMTKMSRYLPSLRS